MFSIFCKILEELRTVTNFLFSTLNETLMYVGLILYNSRICWSILMRFVLLNCLKQRECHGQNKNLKNVKLAILWGKNIIFAMRGRQRENEFGKAVIAMRGKNVILATREPHRQN